MAAQMICHGRIVRKSSAPLIRTFTIGQSFSAPRPSARSQHDRHILRRRHARALLHNPLFVTKQNSRRALEFQFPHEFRVGIQLGAYLIGHLYGDRKSVE